MSEQIENLEWQIHKDLDKYLRWRQERSRAQQVREVEERVSKSANPKFRGRGPYLSDLVYDHTSCYHLVIPGLQKETLVWYGILKSERIGELKGQPVSIFNLSTTLDWDTYRVQRIDRKSFFFKTWEQHRCHKLLSPSVLLPCVPGQIFV